MIIIMMMMMMMMMMTMMMIKDLDYQPLISFNFRYIVISPLNFQVKWESFTALLILFALLTVDGGFGTWSAWSTCSETCGTGTQSRSRPCDNPTPADGGQNCTGDFTQAKSCKLTSCPGEQT